MAILSNRYLLESHRSLIQDSLPAAALTRDIQANAAYLATLARTFPDVGTVADATALTSELRARVTDLQVQVDALAQDPPEFGEPEPPAFGSLEAAVTAQADATLTRLQTRDRIEARLAAVAVNLAELEDITARQADTARVQVTATIADLYDVPPEALTDRLDQLADVNFFVYDRLYELSRAVEALRVGFGQVARVPDPAVLADLQAGIEEALETADRRTAYLPSASARSRAEDLLAGVAGELAPAGVIELRHRGFDADAELAVALDALQTQTDALVVFADVLFARMQSEAVTSQSRTERISLWISLVLAGVLVAAVIAAVLVRFVVVRRIVSRLNDVSRHIMALSRGDYDRDIPTTGSDEIGRLERALHVLRLRAAEARRLRDELEDAVAQRTAEVVTEMNAHDLARDEAEAANRAKTEFLAMMGHEIRTPLNGIVGMLRLLEQDQDNPEGRKRAEIARQSAETLLTLANDILDYTATQGHRPLLEPVHFEIRELLGQLGGYLRANAEAKGLRVAIDMAADVPPVLLGDAQKIRQVVVNLLSNAVKYTDEGNVSLFLDHAPDAEGALHLLSFSISDTGIGIDPADHGRIFDAYARGERPAGVGIEGLGLGLSISRRLTEALGGTLSLESLPGAGSRFTLTVPLAEGDPAKVVRGGERAARADLGLRVLVVEDQPVNRMVARGYLERLGCVVSEAETGAEGVRRATQETFDMVLMDIDLPDMSGGDAAGRIRAALPNPPRIAALTAHRIENSPQKRAQLHVDAMLYKPLSPRALSDFLGAAPAASRASEVPAGVRDTLAGDIEDIGADETAGIVAAFLAEVDPARATMQAAMASADMEALAKQAHRLKGAASNFALGALCDDLAAIEDAARQGGNVAGRMPGLEETLDASVATLRAAAHELGLQLSTTSASR